MQYAFIVFRSVTHGQKGKAAADRLGIRSALQRSPRELSPSGCAYALALQARDLDRLLPALERENARISGVYLRRPDGGYERTSP